MPAPTPIPLFGYRNLANLKARLLPDAMTTDTTWDVDIAAIGKGVAAWFDRQTGRELVYNAAAVFERPAGVESVVLKSYPVISIASVTLTIQSSVTTITDAVMGLQKASGIVDFGGCQGTHLDRLEITSAGGYWCDAEDTIAMSPGATPLPDDLLQAWYLQCRAVCDAENIFRQKGAGNSADKDKRDPALRLDTLDIIPTVKKILQLYLRIP